jgi:hypothetical protein
MQFTKTRCKEHNLIKDWRLEEIQDAELEVRELINKNLNETIKPMGVVAWN